MNPLRGLPLAAIVSIAGALVSASGPAGGAANQARIADISLHVNPKGTSVVIEVSEPVPYVATQPDPVTIDMQTLARSGEEIEPAVAKAFHRAFLFAAAVAALAAFTASRIPHVRLWEKA